MQRSRIAGRLNKSNNISFARASGFKTLKNQLKANAAGVKSNKAKSRNLVASVKRLNPSNQNDKYAFHRVNVQKKKDLILDFTFTDEMNAIELYSDSNIGAAEAKDATYNTLHLPSIKKNRVILNKPLIIYFNGSISTTGNFGNVDDTSQTKTNTTGIVAIQCSNFDADLKLFNSSTPVTTGSPFAAELGKTFIHNYETGVSNNKYFIRLLPTKRGWILLSCNMRMSFVNSINNNAVATSQQSTTTEITSYYANTYAYPVPSQSYIKYPYAN